MFLLCRVLRQCGRLRIKEKAPNFEGGRDISIGCTNGDRFRGIGTRIGQSKKDGPLTDRKSCISNTSEYFGISCLSVGKVEGLEGSTEKKYLVITCTLTVNNQEVPTHALINCRAAGIEFLDHNFAPHHQIPLQDVKERNQVKLINVRPIKSGDITHISKVGMKIQNCGEQVPMFVTKRGHYPSELGIPWLRLHDVAVCFTLNHVTFGT